MFGQMPTSFLDENMTLREVGKKKIILGGIKNEKLIIYRIYERFRETK